MRQLDRQITFKVLSEVGTPNKWGESNLVYTDDVDVWAYRRTVGTIMLPPSNPGEPFEHVGLRASWVIRWRDDIDPVTTGFKDAEGRQWRVESIRELPERGRDKYAELDATTLTSGPTIPPARRT